MGFIRGYQRLVHSQGSGGNQDVQIANQFSRFSQGSADPGGRSSHVLIKNHLFEWRQTALTLAGIGKAFEKFHRGHHGDMKAGPGVRGQKAKRPFCRPAALLPMQVD